MRKIVHIDMDAFYASVEIRDQPDLCGKPVVVAWDGPRSVICAASYEARQFGLRSAMSVARAKQLCPHAIYIAPSFDKYRDVSRQVHDIFHQYTDLIEPLSLGEAYLDVTSIFRNLPTATDVAQAIRAEIFAQTRLTASAGVAPNKFLAKIASDWNKPNGLCVIKPSQVTQFLPNLPVGKIPGVGQVTLQKMQALNIQTVGELAQHSQAELAHHFGRYGYRLYDLARGIDERPVNASRERQQISKETTFSEDKFLPELGEHWHHLGNQVWEQMQKKQMNARTITIKLKTSQFKTITRSVTYSSHIPHYTEFQAAVLLMIERLTPELNHQLMFRLAGVGVAELALQQQQAQLRLLE